MGSAQMREELHRFINQADDRILRLVYSMMKADLDQDEYQLSEEHKRILDERIAAHKNNPTEGSSWEEVKQRIMNKT